MVALWNRFREARNNHAQEFEDKWGEIEKTTKDRDRNKQVCLFRWVKCRGFTDAFMKEVNSLVHTEALVRGRHMLEYHQLCAQLALKPQDKSTEKFIADGVRVGKYDKTPHPEIPGLDMHVITSWTETQTIKRRRVQELEESKKADPDLVKRFRQTVATPLSRLANDTPEVGTSRSSGGNKLKDKKRENRPEPAQQDGDEAAADDEEGEVEEEDGEDEEDDAQPQATAKETKKVSKQAADAMAKIQKAIAEVYKASGKLTDKPVHRALKRKINLVMQELQARRDGFQEVLANPKAPDRRAEVKGDSGPHECRHGDVEVLALIPHRGGWQSFSVASL